MLVEWCWQADRKGLLQGDMCLARSIAKDISTMFEVKVNRTRQQALITAMENLFDIWVKLEHPQAWSMIHAGEEDGVDNSMQVDLSADSMSGLVAQLAAMDDADIAREEGR